MRARKKSRVSAAERKTKPCFVRLEKVRSNSLLGRGATGTKIANVTTKSNPAQGSDEKINKKLTGPIKKRPIVSSPAVTPDVNHRRFATLVPKKAVIEETNATLAMGRSRRAPKPNPKYSNKDIITPKLKFHSHISEEPSSTKYNRKNGEFSNDSSESEDLYNRGNSSLSDSTGEEEDDIIFELDSESDFEAPRRKRGRPKRIDERPAISEKKVLIPPTFLPNSRQSAPQQIIIRKNVGAAVPIARPSTNVAKIRASSTQPFISSSETSRKRKLNQTDFEKERENIIARNNRLNIALYDANSNKPVITPHRTNAAALAAKSQSQNNFRKIVPSHLGNKMMPINQAKKTLPSTTTPIATAASSPPISKKTLTNSALLKLSSPDRYSSTKLSFKQQSSARTAFKAITTTKASIKIPSPLPTPVSPKETPLLSRSTERKNSTEKTSPASTQDDFEIMPTFTIVNINDIINKKGDVLTHKNQSGDVSKSNSSESKEKSPSSISPPVSPIPTGNKQSRRKTGHTSLLSEKIDPVRLKNPLPRTTFPPPKKPAQLILNHTLSNKNSANPRGRPPLSGSKTKFIEKPAPRILNSVVAKKTLPIQPMISKCSDPDDPDSADDNFSLFDDTERCNTPVLPTSNITAKKSIISNNNMVTAKENNRKLSSIMTKPLQRKLPSEKVVVSRQGNKLIKKITCFETWYVINIPEDEPAEIVRNSFELPLIKLANGVNAIKLPSSAWNNKVNLYQVPSQMLGKTLLTKYTGDLIDQSIPEEDRTKYQPSSVMFRRTAQERSKTRLPYDRAVIFKNKTFFTNIDGKNVKLLGAPTNISSLEEIEVLLELIDELNLHSPFVEQTSTI